MSIKINSLGDIMLGENVHHYKRGIIKRYAFKYRHLISEDIKSILNECNVVIFNLESSLASAQYIENRNIQNGVYISPPSSLELFNDISAQKVANIANNHFFQHGPAISDSAIETLISQGIYVIGNNNTPVTMSFRDKILKVWGVSLVKDNYNFGGYFQSTYDKLISDLSLNKKEPNEYWVISIHWGDEYMSKENLQQTQLAAELANAGFDLILGHHPHVIQPVRKYGSTWVAFSHGNFIFDQNFSELTQMGIICQFTLPDSLPNLLISHQRDYKVVAATPIQPDVLNNWLKTVYCQWQPWIMRLKMKLELAVHFYELNLSILKSFLNSFLIKFK